MTRLSGDTSAFSAPVPGPTAPSQPTPPSALQLRIACGSGRARPPARIFRSPRIGLDLSHPEISRARPQDHPRVRFVAQPYRYFAHPHLLTANGRGQTFLGVYRACREAGSDEDDDDEVLAEVTRLTGLKAQTARSYLTGYQGGLEGGQLDAFLGAAGKGASASPATFLRMMGTLATLAARQ